MSGACEASSALDQRCGDALGPIQFAPAIGYGLMLLRLLAAFLLLVRLVMADRAACGGAQHAMMARHVTRDSAYDSTFQAPLASADAVAPTSASANTEHAIIAFIESSMVD